MHVGLAGAPDSSVCPGPCGQVVIMNVGNFMTPAVGIEMHPCVIALDEAELNSQDEWLRLP